MGLSTWLLMLVAHPKEFRTLMQYHIYHDQNRDITAPREHATSGWDRASMRRCWEFLDMTSRSFSAVIKELEGDLARVICIFYLVLRALDTIEDDMTLPASVKQPLLRAFHEHTLVPGFSFTGSGPDEKDAPLLVEYPVVVEELLRLPQVYRDAIVSITAKMGAGMADFALRADAALAAEKAGGFGLETAEEYDLYCHYVAGLVGEGLSLLFAASGKEAPSLGAQLELSNSMALLLQKTNITRDIAEDVAQRRYFWPRDMWGPAGARFGGGFARMEDVVAAAPVSAAAFVDEKAALRGAQPQALFVLSAMVVDTLRHAPDALDYLRLLKNQSIFNFCAIPASMAVATLELCFMNPEVLQRNVKIRKAVAASLIMRSTNPREVGLIFREYARKMHARALPSDPNFTRLSVACGKIEQWCEHYYPSFINLSAAANGGPPAQSIDESDARGRTFAVSEKREAARAQRLRIEMLRAGIKPAVLEGRVPAQGMETSEIMMYVMATVLGVVGLIAGVVWLIMQVAD